MLQDPTEVSTMTAMRRRHVPVAIKFVIDITTDIHKPGHDGQTFSAEKYKKRAGQYRNENMARQSSEELGL
jgi:hypothetical protein